ncbi:hypothetical protein [Pannonibacter sp. SL95]|uniref:hypothetical protein n=1 Tax=Pannonibacter sp. SL95 TaxID=2995153 RepID=UPI002272F8EB|nr:hypothetical protein [Pannonibacter sp. SL95]MCY1708993.1 hypothetical protein [Pannonibacter sp. SL95]
MQIKGNAYSKLGAVNGLKTEEVQSSKAAGGTAGAIASEFGAASVVSVSKQGAAQASGGIERIHAAFKQPQLFDAVVDRLAQPLNGRVDRSTVAGLVQMASAGLDDVAVEVGSTLGAKSGGVSRYQLPAHVNAVYDDAEQSIIVRDEVVGSPEGDDAVLEELFEHIAAVVANATGVEYQGDMGAVLKAVSVTFDDPATIERAENDLNVLAEVIKDGEKVRLRAQSVAVLQSPPPYRYDIDVLSAKDAVPYIRDAQVHGLISEKQGDATEKSFVRHFGSKPSLQYIEVDNAGHVASAQFGVQPDAPTVTRKLTWQKEHFEWRAVYSSEPFLNRTEDNVVQEVTASRTVLQSRMVESQKKLDSIHTREANFSVEVAVSGGIPLFEKADAKTNAGMKTIDVNGQEYTIKNTVRLDETDSSTLKSTYQVRPGNYFQIVRYEKFKVTSSDELAIREWKNSRDGRPEADGALFRIRKYEPTGESFVGAFTWRAGSGFPPVSPP